MREVQDLNGLWELRVPAQDTVIRIKKTTAFQKRAFRVPGVWETLAGLEKYRGEALAIRRFKTRKAGAARLIFKGVSHTAQVYLDGKLIGKHHNAFTPFNIDIPSLKSGKHTLCLRISNEHGKLSALHVPNDYYNYGGINRPVELQLLKRGAYIRYVHFTPFKKKGTWCAKFKARVDMLDKASSLSLKIHLAGSQASFNLDALPGKNEIQGELSFENIKPWSPKKPMLYSLKAKLLEKGQVIDDLIDRVGFRTVEVKGQKILLNGKPVFLYGFNRHEDHGAAGNAQTMKIIRRDIALMKDLGCNAVRTSHYPNDERFLDLCDKNGIMVWEENHARGFNLEAMRHPRFAEQCERCNDEMVTWHFNHPSIVLWGILNECASETKQGRAIYARQFKQIRSLDRSRPTTFASCRHGSDICQDLPDVCGWNWYFNWYGNSSVKQGLKEQLRWLNKTAAKDKPIIASEFGGEGLRGFKDPKRRAKWSEDRQADILDECLTVFLKHKSLSGAFIWQFCDVRVDESWAPSRARCMNNKGVVDEFRRPKMSYAVVRRHFHAMRNR